MGKLAKPEKKQEAREAKEQKKASRQRKKSFPYLRSAAVGFACIVPSLVVAIFLRIEQPNPREVFTEAPVSYPSHADYRPKSCATMLQANAQKESVSVIIPYLDEEWFRILASMQSFLKYTDMSLVNEIMWISDGSSAEKVFATELKALHGKVSVHQNPENLGLMVTKMQAVARAKGSILLFLEPHVLVGPGWLPPLLNRIAENPKLLVMPMLDVLDGSLKNTMATHGHWRFEWNMNLVYMDPLRLAKAPQGSEPYMSPATSGGIYAIRKDFWNELDLFDPQMNRWGGDHVEATLKVWRCGGRIEIHPCSRVAHWFRSPENRPYPVEWDIVSMNYKRLAEVWFDNYTHKFSQLRPEVAHRPMADLAEMKSRREKLVCKSMDWYVKNVDLEMGWEADKVCIPGVALDQGGCGSKEAVPRLSTVTEYIPLSAYRRLMKDADAFK